MAPWMMDAGKVADICRWRKSRHVGWIDVTPVGKGGMPLFETTLLATLLAEGKKGN